MVVVVCFIRTAAIRLIVVALPAAGVAVTFRGCLVQAVAATTISSGLVIAVWIIATLLVVVVW